VPPLPLKSRNPAFQAADVQRMPRNHPGIVRKELRQSAWGAGGSVWDAAFPDRPNYSSEGIWALSGMPAFPWETLGAKDPKDPRNPWRS
jgi:hypothetical protein